MNIKKVVIHTDGVSRGNPGRAAIGATIKDEQGKLIASISQPIGLTTNNQAEYRAIIAALEKAMDNSWANSAFSTDFSTILTLLESSLPVIE